MFGAFTSPQLGIATQVPIRSLEARSGISFGKLAAVDPLAGEEESLTGSLPRRSSSSSRSGSCGEMASLPVLEQRGAPGLSRGGGHYPQGQCPVGSPRRPAS